jgi:Domain of unknown function (DUF4386)
MRDAIPQRVVGIAGIIFVVALLVGGFAIAPSSMPKVNESAAKWATYVADHRSRLQVSNYVSGISFVALLFFASALSNFFARIEGALRGPSTLIVVGGATTVAVAAMGGVFSAVLDYRTGAGSDPGVVRALVDGQTLAFTLIGFPAAVLLAGGGISTLRNGGLPRWLGWLALVAGVLSLAGAGAQAATGTFGNEDVFSGLGFASFIALLVWVLLTSLLLGISGFRGRATGPEAAAAA